MHIRAQLCVGRVVRSWRTCHPWPLCVDYIWYGFPKRDKGESQGGPGKGMTAMFFSYILLSFPVELGGQLAGWLAGGLAGWLRPREAQRGPERRSVDRTSLSCAWHTYKHTYTLPSQQPRPKPSQATSAKPAATAEAPVDMARRAPEI